MVYYRAEETREYHELRLKWLEGENPKFHDGTPVPKSYREVLITQSKNEIAEIEKREKGRLK